MVAAGFDRSVARAQGRSANDSVTAVMSVKVGDALAAVVGATSVSSVRVIATLIAASARRARCTRATASAARTASTVRAAATDAATTAVPTARATGAAATTVPTAAGTATATGV